MRRLLLFAWAVSCYGQNDTLRVFSEFTRVDPFGKIVRQDRGKTEPRTILSPAFPRNAFSSLRLVVTLDRPAKYTLDIGQNPENAVKVTLYKEKFEKHGDQWIPDGLELVKNPYEGELSGSGEIPGQTTVTFWLDMWVDKNAVVERIKVEPQLWVSHVNDWFTYPMEARILQTEIPKIVPSTAGLPAVTQRSDFAALGPLRKTLCGVPEPAGGASTNARALIRRNVLQHVSLPGAAEKLQKMYNLTAIKAWCANAAPDPVGPEWYLRFRDAAIQARAH